MKFLRRSLALAALFLFGCAAQAPKPSAAQLKRCLSHGRATSFCECFASRVPAAPSDAEVLDALEACAIPLLPRAAPWDA